MTPVTVVALLVKTIVCLFFHHTRYKKANEYKKYNRESGEEALGETIVYECSKLWLIVFFSSEVKRNKVCVKPLSLAVCFLNSG